MFLATSRAWWAAVVSLTVSTVKTRIGSVLTLTDVDLWSSYSRVITRGSAINPELTGEAAETSAGLTDEVPP